jgi:hypothetical protein
MRWNEFAKIWKLESFPDALRNAMTFQVTMKITDYLLKDASIPKNHIVKALVQEFQKAIQEFTGLRAPMEIPPPLETRQPNCLHCGLEVEKEADMTAVITTREPGTQMWEVLHWNGAYWSYWPNISIFHRECFEEIAGEGYVYKYDRSMGG